MPKQTKAAVAISVQSFDDAPRIGEAYGGDGTGNGAYEIPTGEDWIVYDMYVCGMLPLEIEQRKERPASEILADIEYMRQEIRAENPGATDLECDAIRRESLFIKAGFIDGSAPGLSRAEAAHNRLFALQQMIVQRETAERRRSIE